jgi:hypothetical protein
MAYWHGLYDEPLYEAIQSNDCEEKFEYASFKSGFGVACTTDLIKFYENINNINIYDVYRHCYTDQGNNEMELYPSKKLGVAKVGDEIKTYKNYYTSADYTPWAYPKFSVEHNLESSQHALLGMVPPCVYATPIIDYLNREDVRENLHIPTNVQAWEYCTDEIGYTSQIEGSQWIYEELQSKYRQLVYSGDTDGSVPTRGTQAWINDLAWEITSDYRPYFYGGQVAGYTETRGSLTFGTVHGCGHMAPQWKRPQTYHLVFNWL